jgi:hypothetical protein
LDHSPNAWTACQSSGKGKLYKALHYPMQ